MARPAINDVCVKFEKWVCPSPVPRHPPEAELAASPTTKTFSSPGIVSDGSLRLLFGSGVPRRRSRGWGMTFSSKVERADGRLVFTPAGRVDAESVDDFTAAVVAAAREAKAAGVTLVVDLAQLAFMVSRGLRALTMAQREGAAMKLAAPNAEMAEILKISRYDKLFEILDEA